MEQLDRWVISAIEMSEMVDRANLNQRLIRMNKDIDAIARVQE